MKLIVSFHDGRCFFNGFNSSNDIDPETGKAGINYYRFYLIGCILEKLGLAKGINCFVKDKPKIVFINSKSFLRWRERHSNDDYIAMGGTREEELKMKQKVLDFGVNFEGSIKYIIESYKTLSFDEVIAKAQNELPEDENKKRLLELIKEKLTQKISEDTYMESYNKKKRPYICLSQREEQSLTIIDFFMKLPGLRIDGLK